MNWSDEQGRDRAFRELVDAIPDLVCRFSPDGTLLYVNRSYAEYFGRTQADLIGSNFLELVPADTLSYAFEQLRRLEHLSPERPTRTSEHRGGDSAEGESWQEWVDKACFDEQGHMVDLVAVGRDITERRRNEEAVRYQAHHDHLTGLENRHSIMERLDRSLQAAGRSRDAVGLLYIDLDHFKLINDQFGHAAGDAVLRDVAEVLRSCVRSTDCAGRLGGDEFIIVCAGMEDPERLHHVAARVQAKLHRMQRPLSASIGAVIAEPGERLEHLLHRADAQMYERKGRAAS
ncbi:MAG: sensor domain-containing diguanylate cyclase [Ilumatobacteraceae bacterium]